MASSKGNIAVFITGWDSDRWKKIQQGVQERALEAEYDVSFFSCFGGIDTTHKHDVGEYNIFRLLNLDNYHNFDGIIIESSTIISKKIKTEIFRSVKKYHIPSISLEVMEEGIDFGGIDNYKAMREMVEHFVKYHKFKRICFVTGPEDNTESNERLQAYWDVLKEDGREVEGDDIYIGTYEFQSGYAAADYFKERSKGLPDAVICANDDMAMGLCRRFEELSISVPDQVAVAGFDNINKAANFCPHISSVKRPMEELGYQACDYLLRKIHGEEMEGGFVCETQGIFRRSCGCSTDDGYTFEEFRNVHFKTMEHSLFMTKMLNNMTEDLTTCDTFGEQLKFLKKYIEVLNCKCFYLCVDPGINFRDERIKIENMSNEIRKSSQYRIKGYPAMMEVPLAYRNGEFVECEVFPTRQLLPGPEPEKGHVYMYLPIHFQDRCFGYCIVVDAKNDMSSANYYQWLMNIGNSIETIRRKQIMNVAIRKLDDMYTRDSLTKLYNRFGFSRYSQEIYQRCQMEKVTMMIMFIDLDGLKKINDYYGHESGDIAIKTVADSLLKIKKPDEIVTRHGGDEFILIGLDYTEDKALHMIRKLNRELERRNEKANLPFEVEASAGYYILLPEGKVSLEKGIEIADKRMYKNKYEKRQRQEKMRSEANN